MGSVETVEIFRRFVGHCYLRIIVSAIHIEKLLRHVKNVLEC